MRWTAALVLVVVLGAGCGRGEAPAVRVAVAANFAGAFGELARRFEAASGRTVAASVGSTGKLYAQIRNGAPFALFFAADAERPARLEEAGLAVAGTRCTYCTGRLVLWSASPHLVDATGGVLATDRFRHLAIANPDLAPYGAAARAVLEARGLWDAVRPRLIRGENIGQTFQFVASGNADLGFVAASQLETRGARAHADGSRWDVPASLHPPIAQQAVVLDDDPVARAFLAFVRGPEGRRIIARHGYGATP